MCCVSEGGRRYRSLELVHSEDLQDSLVEVTGEDCLADAPLVEGCGLWLDHHPSEGEHNATYKGKYRGESQTSPSCAYIIYDYYGGREWSLGYDDLLEAVDKVDSANLSINEVLYPSDQTLLGFITDPRTGLGRFYDFRISNYALMEEVIDWCGTKDIHGIMAEAGVRERIKLYQDQNDKFIDMLKAHTTVENRIIISDLRDVNPIYTGNRSLICSLYPGVNISTWIVNDKGGKGCLAAVGYSILNGTYTTDVGTLMLRRGGDGHRVVGTCQFSDDTMEEKLGELLKDIKRLND